MKREDFLTESDFEDLIQEVADTDIKFDVKALVYALLTEDSEMKKDWGKDILDPDFLDKYEENYHYLETQNNYWNRIVNGNCDSRNSASKELENEGVPSDYCIFDDEFYRQYQIAEEKVKKIVSPLMKMCSFTEGVIFDYNFYEFFFLLLFGGRDFSISDIFVRRMRELQENYFEYLGLCEDDTIFVPKSEVEKFCSELEAKDVKFNNGWLRDSLWCFLEASNRRDDAYMDDVWKSCRENLKEVLSQVSLEEIDKLYSKEIKEYYGITEYSYGVEKEIMLSRFAYEFANLRLDESVYEVFLSRNFEKIKYHEIYDFEFQRQLEIFFTINSDVFKSYEFGDKIETTTFENMYFSDLFGKFVFDKDFSISKCVVETIKCHLDNDYYSEGSIIVIDD